MMGAEVALVTTLGRATKLFEVDWSAGQMDAEGGNATHMFHGRGRGGSSDEEEDAAHRRRGED